MSLRRSIRSRSNVRVPLRVHHSVGAAAMLVLTAGAAAQVLGPEFATDYSIIDVGSVPGVPTNYGGLLFAPGDFSVLFIGGTANSPAAAIYAAVVKRGADGGVEGFECGDASYFTAAPGVTGGIDGGLDADPTGVTFYTTYSDNRIGQIKPNSVGPDKLIDLTALGVAASTGTLRFVPAGFPGAGRLKIASYNSSLWYDATISPDGNGTFDIALSPTVVQLSGGPEGILYVKAGSPAFAADSVLICEWTTGAVRAYEVDSNGDPLPATARLFISGLSGAEGAASDPVTGDFLFSTYGGGHRVLRVTGFTTGDACPTDLNVDGVVGGADLAIVLGQWGTEGGGLGDLSGDCSVDGADIALVLGQWGPCPR